MRNSMNANLKELCPADFELSANLNEPVQNLDIVSEFKDNGLDMISYTGEYERFYTYGDKNFTLESFCGLDLEVTIQSSKPTVLETKNAVHRTQ